MAGFNLNNLTGGGLTVDQPKLPGDSLSAAPTPSPYVPPVQGPQLTAGIPVMAPKVSTTTISNANKITQVPGIIATTDKLADTGVRTDATTGVTTLANGTAVNTPTDTNTSGSIPQTGLGNDRVGGAKSNVGDTDASSIYTGMPDTSAEDDSVLNNLNEMQRQTDSSTADIIGNIQSNFAQRKAEQADVNLRASKRVNNALLMGGATGQGSSAQFAPISSQGIISSQESFGVKQLAALDSEEANLISQAKAAQAAGNFKIMEDKNAEIQKKRDEKIAYATKLNDAVTAANKIARDKAIQSSRDSAVSDLYAQGITDVPTLLNYLNYDQSGKQVGDFTAEEITNTLKSIVPPGLDDLVKTARNNGAPADVIQGILNSANMADAYNAAGSYASGGTGIIGEYNFYKAQAEARGQVPVDFNTYQNMDANRKAKAAAGGGGTPISISSFDAPTQKALQTNGFTGYGANTQSLAQQLVDGMLAPSDLSKRATGDTSYNDVLTAADKYSMATLGKHFDVAKANRDYKFATNTATQNTLNFLKSLIGTDNGSGTLTGGNLDELKNISDSIDRTSFPALNDTKKWASLATGNADYAQFQAVATEVADQVAKILQGGTSGGGTSDAKLQQASNLFNTGFSKAQLNGVIASLQPLLKNRATSMIGDNPYLSDYADDLGIETNTNPTPSTADQVVQNEDQAKQTVIAYGGTNPDQQAIITSMIKDGIPYLQIKATLGI